MTAKKKPSLAERMCWPIKDRVMEPDEASARLGISMSQHDNLVVAGELPAPKRIGNRKVYSGNEYLKILRGEDISVT